MGPLAIWEMYFSCAQETWVPKPENDARRQPSLPFGVRGDNLVHQRENPLWLVIHFYVNIEFDVLVLWLLMEGNL